MAGETNLQVRSNSQVGMQNAQAPNSRGRLEKLPTPPMDAKLLENVKKHRSDNLNAFHAALDRGQREGIANVLHRAVGANVAKDFEALFGKGSALVTMAQELKANADSIAHLRSKDNVEKASTLGLMHRGLEELKTALILADKAPQVSENFAGHEKNLQVMAKRLQTIAANLPASPEGVQMAQLMNKLAQVCTQKSALISANADMLSKLVNYDTAIDSTTQKMDAIDQQMHALGTQNQANPHATANEHAVVAEKMLALSEQHTGLEAQRHQLFQLQDDQEKKMTALPPKLQDMAVEKMSLPAMTSSQSNHNAATYASAIDVLNINIASLYANGNQKAALILIVCRNKLENVLNNQSLKADNESNDLAVKNILPDGAKKLGLIARIRVKFHAKTAAKLGKENKPFQANLGKLNLQTALAAHLQGAFKLAGLKDDALPSKKSLREALRAGMGNPNRPAAFGKVVPVALEKANPLAASFTEKRNKFDSDASSAYAKLVIRSFKPSALTAASVKDLFLARQHASRLLLDPANAGTLDHAKHRQLIDAAMNNRLKSEQAKENLFLDKESKVLDNARLISMSEILEGLERLSSLKNPGRLQIFKDMTSLNQLVNTFLATNDGPVYAILNGGEHWATVLASKNADGGVDTYTVDTNNLQSDQNKGLSNACGPLQILMHAELSQRLAANSGLDAISVMKDIEADLQALDKDTLRSVVLQQRMESLDRVIKNLPPPPPPPPPTYDLGGYAQQIDDMADAFTL